jgi:hypothetical protein
VTTVLSHKQLQSIPRQSWGIFQDLKKA